MNKMVNKADEDENAKHTKHCLTEEQKRRYAEHGNQPWKCKICNKEIKYKCRFRHFGTREHELNHLRRQISRIASRED